MRSRLLFLLAAFALSAAGLPAQAPPKQPDKKPADAKQADKKPDAKPKAVLKVLVPEDDAELTILGQAMKTTGTTREFDIPDVEPGKLYEYEFVVKYEPNNYTKITRIRTVQFKGGEPVVTVDLTKPDEKTDKVVVRYVPTPEDIVKQMVKLANVTKDDVIYELGCGDARILINSVKEGGAKKGVGIDLDPERVKESKENVKSAKLDDKIEIRQGDALKVDDLASASVVMIYMSDELGVLLGPMFQRTLKPGTRIVSHRFKLGDWKPDKSITVTGEDGDEYELHLWVKK